MNVRPLQDRILVRRVEEVEKTRGGIIIPDSAKERPLEGKVIAVGSRQAPRGRHAGQARRQGGRPDPVRQVRRHRDQDRRRRAHHPARGRSPRRHREVRRHAMAAKDIIFDEKARSRVARGRRHPRQRRQGHPRPARPQRRHREVVGRPHGHQGRRHRRQGDRAREQVREHGRADGQGGRLQDLRHRRRRHHHRHRARAGDLPRGRASSSRPVTTRWSSSAASTPPSTAVVESLKKLSKPDQGQGRDRAGRHDQRQRRRRDRQDDRRGDGEGRQGRRDHRRGGQDDGPPSSTSSRACSSTAATSRRTS